MAFAYHAVHQDPITYPDPEKFDPDRFSPEKNLNGNNFMGFGAGPRSCIGKMQNNPQQNSNRNLFLIINTFSRSEICNDIDENAISACTA